MAFFFFFVSLHKICKGWPEGGRVFSGGKLTKPAGGGSRFSAFCDRPNFCPPPPPPPPPLRVKKNGDGFFYFYFKIIM